MKELPSGFPVPLDFVLTERSVKEVIHSRTKDRRFKGLANPNLDVLPQTSYDGVVFSKKYLNLMCLILIVWYSDYFGDWRSYILYEVRVYLERNLLWPELAAACAAKEVSLLMILSYSQVYSKRQFFSTVLDPKRIDKILRSTHLRLTSRSRIREKVRRRGYQDRGNLRPPEKWRPSFAAFGSLPKSLVIQKCIEQNREEYSNLVDFFVSLAGDWLLQNQRFLERERS